MINSLIFSQIFFLLWAVVAAYWDVKRSTILPLWLVVLPPIVATYRLLDISLMLACLFIVALLSTESPLIFQILSFGVFSGIAFYLDQPLLAITVFAIWLVWALKTIGGGDAIALLSLVAAFPEYEMLGAIIGALLIWGIAILIFKGEMSKLLLVFLRMRLGNLPTESELDEKGAPAMPAILMAICIYCGIGIIA